MADKVDIRAPVAIREIPIELLDPFPNHPYKVVDDADMDQLVESIRAKGLLTPCIVRKMNGNRFELVAGHRRKHACEKLGFETLKCEVLEISREEATILMVESNFQRDRILPSEKAFAYKMRLEAMKKQISRMRQNQKKGMLIGGEPPEKQIEEASTHLQNSYLLDDEDISKIGNEGLRESKKQKTRNDDILSPVGTQVGRTTDPITQGTGDGKTQIYRYIRLTELIPGILNLVDEGKIGVRTAVELSYLGPHQNSILECMELNESYPTQAQAIRMRRLFEKGELSSEQIKSIMTESKPNQKERFSMSSEKIFKLLPKNLSRRQTEKYVEAALEHYARYLERKAKGRER